MMKINLLGQEAPESRLAVGSSESARQVLVFAVALAVCMTTVGFVYYYWSHQITQARAALTREQIRRLTPAGAAPAARSPATAAARAAFSSSAPPRCRRDSRSTNPPTNSA